MNFNDPLVSVQDLAIIPIDERIPLSVVSPAKLPFDRDRVEPCPSGFNGTYQGFRHNGPPKQATWPIVRHANVEGGDVYRAQFSVEQTFFGELRFSP
jgi:hypothetical protein